MENFKKQVYSAGATLIAMGFFAINKSWIWLLAFSYLFLVYYTIKMTFVKNV